MGDHGVMGSNCDRVAEAMVGRFWLSGMPDVVVSGRLTVGGERLRLDLDGSLTPALKLDDTPAAASGGAQSFVPTDGLDDPPLTVHGDVTIDGRREAITLVDAFTTARTHGAFEGLTVGSSVGRQQLGAPYAVRGAHIDGADELFTGVRLRTRHLGEWASLAGFTHSVSPDHSTVTLERQAVPPVPLANGGLVHLDQDLSWSSETDAAALTGTVWLRIDSLPTARWRQLDRAFVTPLVTLLTLAVDGDCPPIEVELARVGDAGTEWLSMLSSSLRSAGGPSKPVRDMLTPRHVLGLAGVAQWLDRVDDLGPLPPVVAAAVAGPPLTVEAGVLELTTVAEGLARRLWPEWNRFAGEDTAAARRWARDAVARHDENMAAAVDGALAQLHEPSYPQRLERLASHADTAVPGVLGRRTDKGRPSRWKNAVVDARNDFAHRLDRGWLDEPRLDRYLAVYLSLRWLLTGVLLLETGLPAGTLAARLANHQAYQLFLRQASQWLPAIYD